MRRSRMLAAVAVVTSLASSGAFAAACERAPKVIHYDGSMDTMFVSTEHRTEIVAPDSLVGALPDPAQGVEVREVPVAGSAATALDNRLFIKLTDDTYVGTLWFHTSAGKSYHTQLLARAGCGNTKVKIIDARRESDDKVRGNGRVSRDKGSLSLIGHMYLSAVTGNVRLPQGYHRTVVDGSKEERLIYQQGSVSWFIEEIWRGRRKNGFLLRVVNEGRTPFRVQIEGLEFSSRQVREVFGRVRRIAMEPTSLRLGAAPEFAVDALHPKNVGHIFIESEAGR